jgi:hypothetical protein
MWALMLRRWRMGQAAMVVVSSGVLAVVVAATGQELMMGEVVLDDTRALVVYS